MECKVNRILILNMFKKSSSVGVYSYNLKNYFDKKENCQVKFVDLYEDGITGFTKLLKILLYKNKEEFDFGFMALPLTSRCFENKKIKNTICIVHDIYHLKNGFILKKAIIRYLYKFSLNFDKLVFISNFAKEEFIDFYSKDKVPKNKMIYGGIHKIFFENQKNRRKQYDFIHIGANIERKNFKFVLQILKHFKGKSLLKIGEVSSEDRLFIKRNNLKVYFVERCSEEDKKQYLEKSRILLSPSFYEGFGLCPIEAAASNCRVLSAKNTGLLESNLEENLLPLDKDIWIDKINKIFSEQDTKILQKQKEFSQLFKMDNFLKELDKFVFGIEAPGVDAPAASSSVKGTAQK